MLKIKQCKLPKLVFVIDKASSHHGGKRLYCYCIEKKFLWGLHPILEGWFYREEIEPAITLSVQHPLIYYNMLV